MVDNGGIWDEQSFRDFEINRDKDTIKQLEAQLAGVKQLLEKAYLAGFNATGEGYNGEYPFRDKDQWPDDNADWCQERDENLKELLEETNG